jgi:subtilisin family serine protease
VPQERLIYALYVGVVAFARQHGTTIVAAAGNEHVRIGAGGRVLSHGQLTEPGTPPNQFVDLFGMLEVPGGIPGVVDVAATGNVVNAPSASCPVRTAASENATCKPAGDAHQPFGVGKQNQLAYYSNYGPRIDLAAPGGARKFNLPVWDRGGTPGFPVTTADGFAAWETFSTTSNWATQIPCFVFTGGGFPPDQCYSTIQGTSMATPHVSAVVALLASKNPAARGNPDALIKMLKSTAQKIKGNATPPLSATDASAGDLATYPGACVTGYCHLGGSPIPDAEAYGAGLVDARAGAGKGAP